MQTDKIVNEAIISSVVLRGLLAAYILYIIIVLHLLKLLMKSQLNKIFVPSMKKKNQIKIKFRLIFLMILLL